MSGAKVPDSGQGKLGTRRPASLDLSALGDALPADDCPPAPKATNSPFTFEHRPSAPPPFRSLGLPLSNPASGASTPDQSPENRRFFAASSQGVARPVPAAARNLFGGDQPAFEADPLVFAKPAFVCPPASGRATFQEPPLAAPVPVIVQPLETSVGSHIYDPTTGSAEFWKTVNPKSIVVAGPEWLKVKFELQRAAERAGDPRAAAAHAIATMDIDKLPFFEVVLPEFLTRAPVLPAAPPPLRRQTGADDLVPCRAARAAEAVFSALLEVTSDQGKRLRDRAQPPAPVLSAASAPARSPSWLDLSALGAGAHASPGKDSPGNEEELNEGAIDRVRRIRQKLDFEAIAPSCSDVPAHGPRAAGGYPPVSLAAATSTPTLRLSAASGEDPCAGLGVPRAGGAFSQPSC